MSAGHCPADSVGVCSDNTGQNRKGVESSEKKWRGGRKGKIPTGSIAWPYIPQGDLKRL